MSIKDFLKKHNLIGSLLESIAVDSEDSSVCLEIDYCYWQQSDYNEGDEETGIVFFKFENCTSYSFDEHLLNSDEIVKVENIDDEIDICVESDITGEYHHIKINCLNVQEGCDERF